MFDTFSEPVSDLVTYRAMPTPSVTMNQFDPFIFLNHHGRQEYLPKNNGLPFGPHHHRGFETVTFILEGELTHKDTSGASGTIHSGGVKWMTAGSGIVHAEISSEEFKLKGGPLEMLQLWINLPAKYKMTAPRYAGLQKEDIPIIKWDDQKVTAHLVSGLWDGVEAPVHPFTDIHLSWIEFKEGGKHNFTIAINKNISCYLIRGALIINGDEAEQHCFVEFNTDVTTIELKAITDAVLLFGYATPFKEPIVFCDDYVRRNSTGV